MAVPAIVIRGSDTPTSAAIFSKPISIHHSGTIHRFQTKWPNLSLGGGFFILSNTALEMINLLRWVSPTLQGNEYAMCVTTQKAAGFPAAFRYLK